jgi:hypothetical protein
MKNGMFALALLTVGSLSLGGCKAKLEGSLTVNGAPFEVSSCRSGQANGFMGVDLSNEAGATIRLVQTPMNVPQVLYLQGEGAQATMIGTCGSLTIRTQNSTINDIRNVEGNANLQCAGAVTIAGAMRFQNCH